MNIRAHQQRNRAYVSLGHICGTLSVDRVFDNDDGSEPFLRRVEMSETSVAIECDTVAHHKYSISAVQRNTRAWKDSEGRVESTPFKSKVGHFKIDVLRGMEPHVYSQLIQAKRPPISDSHRQSNDMIFVAFNTE